MSVTVPQAQFSQKTDSETKDEIALTGSVPQDSKSSPEITRSLTNGTTSGNTKLDIRKPPPPAQPKPLRFLKTKSLTLPKLGHKNSSSKTKETKEAIKEGGDEITGEAVVVSKPQDSNAKLRDSPLWKLPGMSTLIKNRRHSTAVDGTSSAVTTVQRKSSNTPPAKKHTIPTLIGTPPRPPRELPPLPTIPPLGVPLPPSTTPTQDVSQGDVHVDTQNISPLPLDFVENTTTSTPQSVTTNVNPMDAGEGNNPANHTAHQFDSSLTHSVESLSHQMAGVPQSSSTPTSVHRSTPNGSQTQVEKADTIHSLIEKYSRHVPLRMRVLQGYCSDTADINISTGDLYDVQTMKTTQVVTIRDQDGMTYRVPVESATKFGLIFNLSSNYDEGLCGYTFRTVSDLTSLSILPRIVCTVKAFEGNDGRSSVQENEILVIQQALKSMFRGKRGIKVYSLLTKSEKVLPEDCDVGFSTNPSLIRLPLSEIIAHISNPFPAHAVMYPNSADNTDQDIPGKLSCLAIYHIWLQKV